MNKLILSEDFKAIKEQVLARELVRKSVKLSQISITADSLKDSTIELAGSTVPVSPGFFVKLASFLKMTASLTNEMIKKGDTQMVTAMMNALKQYRTKATTADVLLVADPTTREIIDIMNPDRYQRLSNGSLLDLSERILTDKPNLSIETIDGRGGGGGMSINFLNNNEIGFPGAGPDEFFKFGFSLIQDNKSTRVEMYNQRLICTNGLRTSLGAGAIGGNRAISFNESFKLASTSQDSILQFIQNIDAMAKAEFVPSSFQEVLETAANTRASLFEVETAMLAAQALVAEADVDMRNRYLQSIGKNYFHGHSMTMQRVARKGVNPLEINDRQKQLITTPMSIWDVVNSMTYLGSNNSGIPFDDQFTLKNKAGQLFGKGTNNGFDLQYAEFAQL